MLIPVVVDREGINLFLGMLCAGVGEERTSAFVLLSFKESSVYIEETELNQTLVLEERCFILLCTEPTGFG